MFWRIFDQVISTNGASQNVNIDSMGSNIPKIGVKPQPLCIN